MEYKNTLKSVYLINKCTQKYVLFIQITYFIKIDVNQNATVLNNKSKSRLKQFLLQFTPKTSKCKPELNYTYAFQTICAFRVKITTFSNKCYF